ncbi:MAG: UDP-N-acetylmuramate dehydrogenase [Turneriella sp.]|nr:UDP-N-acetylmuramate dehydrogenase [Turneriella sp.]
MPELAALENFLVRNNIPFRHNEILARYTTFRLGGPADIFVLPRHPEDCALLQQHLYENPLPVFVLGGGSNLLVADAGFRGVVVHPDFGEEFHVLYRSPERLRISVPASARAPLTGKRVSALGYGGLEFLATIPGHFGGSVIQNAGCYGHELCDVLLSVTAVRGGEVIKLSNANCRFGYRESLFKYDTSYWIAAAELELFADDQQKIAARLADYSARRLRSQPKNRRSAGSIFKNPPSTISPLKAWQLIEKAGLRGVRHGGAEISAEHCNFIVNNGNATAADVLYLIELAEKRVWESCGVRLEKEVVLVGFN